MATQSLLLQGYNGELIKLIDDMRKRKKELLKEMKDEEEEGRHVHNEIRSLTDRLMNINKSLSEKMEARVQFDRAIENTESSYKRLLEASEMMIQGVRHNYKILGEEMPEASSEDHDTLHNFPSRASRMSRLNTNISRNDTLLSRNPTNVTRNNTNTSSKRASRSNSKT
ncbi:unnamed protein product [Owenia fusiformis]|uniref:Uncharacterized protein n=1 Tax=Owenia fusiformis TaxID=6347 RepID=A0A8J1TC48_OWEFU|nr:unnamed protein product [Owenia fusiformis]